MGDLNGVAACMPSFEGFDHGPAKETMGEGTLEMEINPVEGFLKLVRRALSLAGEDVGAVFYGMLTTWTVGVVLETPFV